MNELDKENRKVGNNLGQVIVIWFVILFLASLTGIWVKFFWIGWVMAK